MRVALLSLLFLIVSPLTAGAFCQLPYPPRICAEFYANDLVFTGKVLSTRYFPNGIDGSGLDGWTYRLRVYKVYRGKLGRTVVVSTDNASDRYPLDNGKSYLLFALQGPEDKIPAIYGCSLSDQLPQGENRVRKIEEILHAKPGAGGHIGGTFVPTGDTKDLSGIRITAHDNGKTYETATAKDGSWDMWVPAGTYNLQASSPHWYISPDDSRSLFPFKNVVIHDGGCADVEFSGMRLMN